MQYKYRILSILVIPLLLVAIIGGCGGSGSSDDGGDAGGSASPRDMIVVEGTIADVVASSKSSENSFFLARIINFINPTQTAIAQEDEMDDLSGIMVTASDGDTEFGPVFTDADGNFMITVPCDTPLTFTFTTEDDVSVDFGEIQFPCPEG